MKIGIIYCAYNTENYVLQSIEPFLADDRFVVSAACIPFQEYKYMGFEEDTTKSLLVELKKQGKLKYLATEPRWVSECVARNAAKSLVEEEVDFWWLVDSDEFYTPTQLDAIVAFLEANPDDHWYSICLKNYVFSTATHLEEPFQPPRIFNNKHGFVGFYWDNDGAFVTEEGQFAYHLFEGKPIPQETVWIDHYSWLDDEISRRKVLYQTKHFGHCSYKWEDGHLKFDESFYAKVGEPIPTLLTK